MISRPRGREPCWRGRARRGGGTIVHRFCGGAGRGSTTMSWRPRRSTLDRARTGRLLPLAVVPAAGGLGIDESRASGSEVGSSCKVLMSAKYRRLRRQPGMSRGTSWRLAPSCTAPGLCIERAAAHPNHAVGDRADPDAVHGRWRPLPAVLPRSVGLGPVPHLSQGFLWPRRVRRRRARGRGCGRRQQLLKGRRRREDVTRMRVVGKHWHPTPACSGGSPDRLATATGST